MATATLEMQSVEQEFASLFTRLTGFEPYPWQTRFFQSLNMNHPVESLYIPTAGGKTGVIPVWLCTVLLQLKKGTLAVPRRMYYAVDRRVVVDQSEIVARDLQ